MPNIWSIRDHLVHKQFSGQTHTRPSALPGPLKCSIINWENRGKARRQEMKWGCFFVKKSGKRGVFCKKNEKWGVFFCKKWTFHQRTVHCVQYQNFLFYILLFFWGGVRTHPTHPPPLPTGLAASSLRDECFSKALNNCLRIVQWIFAMLSRGNPADLDCSLYAVQVPAVANEPARWNRAVDKAWRSLW